MKFVCSHPIEYDPEQVERLSKQFRLSPVAVRTLLRRGLNSPQQIEAFLHPEEQPLLDWREMKGTAEAARLVEQAIKAKNHICVYGDYDADGVCATAILYRCLKKLGAEVTWYIPSRHGEGYGLNEGAVHMLAESGVKLLVTVDNGISALQETALARSLGMQVIVTDHHRSGGELPEADALLSVSEGDFRERVGDLCGAGVAWLLACALEKGEGEAYLPLVAAATVADVVSLTGANRTLVTRGMMLVKKQVGLAALLEAASAGDGPVTETTLGYLIAPRLNAAGRMGDVQKALELLITDDPYEAARLAGALNELNQARRNEEQRILADCLSLAPDGGEDSFLMLAGKGWNVGVIGIVAARLVELFYKPVILLTEVEPGIYTGSARSIPEIDLYALIYEAREHLLRFGGHAGAAGLTVRTEEIETVRDLLKIAYAHQLPGGPPEKSVWFEDVLPLEDCRVELCDELHSFAPFGQGNPEPQFLVRGSLSGVSYLGQGKKHLSGFLSDGQRRLRLVGFSQGGDNGRWFAADRAEVVCTLQKNEFRGRSSCELICLGLSPWKSLQSSQEYTIINTAFLQAVAAGDVQTLRRCANALLRFFPFRLTEESLRPIYVRLVQSAREGRMPEGEEEQAAALIFKELGFFESVPELVPAANVVRRSCTESQLFMALSMR
ncbi:MAG: single-stranded-DNA-specific exonuclease RecJ [Clostridia bacterium]|nr:single-stranded-DNA-specific exonuclease RecJ [Clostridia bacterium]